MTGTNPGYDAPLDAPVPPCPSRHFTVGARTAMLSMYEWPRSTYAKGIPADAPWLKGTGVEPRTTHSAAFHLRELGCLLYYAIEGYGRMTQIGKKVTKMKIDEMVEKWHKAVVGLAVAHDKDEADRYEASIEECLSPILTAPIAQIRDFAPKLLATLKADKSVPFLVWRAYEVWLEEIFNKCADEGVKELKTHLAKEVADLIEPDVRGQLPDAIVRALSWRSGDTLEEVKQVVKEEHSKGRKVRLRGRESCLFVEAGGTEERPAVCVQL